MTLNKNILYKATDTRIQIEKALRSILELPKDEKDVGKKINQIKKKYKISKDDEQLLKRIQKIVSSILHNNQTEPLKEDERIKALQILRNIMLQSSNLKREYEINGNTYYKFVFDKKLMKQLKQRNIQYNTNPRTKSENNAVQWMHAQNIFCEFIYNDIFIPKQSFDTLESHQKKVDCLILARHEDGYTQTVGLSLKESFDVNQLFICSDKMYDDLYNKEIEQDCIEIIIDIEKDNK
jgi:hypothetical protein